MQELLVQMEKRQGLFQQPLGQRTFFQDLGKAAGKRAALQVLDIADSYLMKLSTLRSFSCKKQSRNH